MPLLVAHRYTLTKATRRSDNSYAILLAIVKLVTLVFPDLSGVL